MLKYLKLNWKNKYGGHLNDQIWDKVLFKLIGAFKIYLFDLLGHLFYNSVFIFNCQFQSSIEVMFMDICEHTHRCSCYSQYTLYHICIPCMLQQSILEDFFFSPLVMFKPQSSPLDQKQLICGWVCSHAPNLALKSSPRKASCISAFNLAWEKLIHFVTTLGRHKVSKQSVLLETNSSDDHTAV